MTHTIDSRQWQRSSFCSTGACLEIAHDADAFRIRDAKDPSGPVLAFTAGQGRAFLTAVREGAIR